MTKSLQQYGHTDRLAVITIAQDELKCNYHLSLYPQTFGHQVTHGSKLTSNQNRQI